MDLLRGHSIKAASGRWILGASPTEVAAGNDGSTRSPSSYSLYSTDASEPITVDPPLAKGEFEPHLALGGEDSFLLLGVRCTQFPVEENTSCSPATPLSYRFNPGTKTWTRVQFNDQLGNGHVVNYGHVQETIDGTVALADFGGGRKRLLRLEGTTWVDEAGVNPAVTDFCATKDSLFTLALEGTDMKLLPLKTVKRQN